MKDANCFVLSHRYKIEITPLQLYSSTLLVSLEISAIRTQIREQVSRWVTRMPVSGNDWSQCLQMLKGHVAAVSGAAFSPDGQLIASSLEDKTMKIWHSTTGALFCTLEGHEDWVSGVTFSPESHFPATASADMTVGLWDPITGTLHSLLKGHLNKVHTVAFRLDDQRLASASDDKTKRF